MLRYVIQLQTHTCHSHSEIERAREIEAMAKSSTVSGHDKKENPLNIAGPRSLRPFILKRFNFHRTVFMEGGGEGERELHAPSGRNTATEERIWHLPVLGLLLKCHLSGRMNAAEKRETETELPAPALLSRMCLLLLLLLDVYFALARRTPRSPKDKIIIIRHGFTGWHCLCVELLLCVIRSCAYLWYRRSLRMWPARIARMDMLRRNVVPNDEESTSTRQRRRWWKLSCENLTRSCENVLAFGRYRI